MNSRLDVVSIWVPEYLINAQAQSKILHVHYFDALAGNKAEFLKTETLRC